METRTLNLAPELRSLDKQGQPALTGYAAVYYDGTRSSEYAFKRGAVERIMPGAFKLRDDVIATFNHSTDMLLGRKGAGTLQLTIDNRGLHYSITPADTTIYRDVCEMVKRGDVFGSSFSFDIARDNWTRDGDLVVRELRSVEVAEVAPVAIPSYAGTSVSARSQEAYEKYIKRRIDTAARMVRLCEIRTRENE